MYMKTDITYGTPSVIKNRNNFTFYVKCNIPQADNSSRAV
jgi:hypothetical protein